MNHGPDVAEDLAAWVGWILFQFHGGTVATDTRRALLAVATSGEMPRTTLASEWRERSRWIGSSVAQG